MPLKKGLRPRPLCQRCDPFLRGNMATDPLRLCQLPELAPHHKRLVEDDRVIQAIKEYRQDFNITSLMEAKDRVEQYRNLILPEKCRVLQAKVFSLASQLERAQEQMEAMSCELTALRSEGAGVREANLREDIREAEAERDILQETLVKALRR